MSKQNQGRSIMPALALILCCIPHCSADIEQEARDRLELQADRYEALLLDREEQWLNHTQKGMVKLLFIEAERNRSEEDRTSLALKLQDRMNRYGDGIRALSLRLKYKTDADFKPFIAIWSLDGGEFQRAVSANAVIPPAAREGLLLNEGETVFTSGTGADDERRVQIQLYYSNEILKHRMQEIRE